MKAAGLAAVTISLFICGVIATHWAIGFVKWSGMDSGWAQFIGSIAALAAAIDLGERQQSSAIRLLKRADQLALERRLSSIVALMDEIVARVEDIRDLVRGEGVHSNICQASTTLSGNELDHFVMHWACRIMGGRPQFAELVEAIGRIPMHELGHPQIVPALFSARGHLKTYDDQLQKIAIDIDALGDVRPALASASNGSNVTVMLVAAARDQAKSAMVELLAEP